MAERVPSVSVIIPTYNRSSEVARAISSVLRQSFTDLEVIVVDDASPDDTRAVVAGIDDPRVRYLRHETNRGGCDARNTGIEAARGRYLAFLDDDDEWLPAKLDKQLQVMAASPVDPGVVLCGGVYADEEATKTGDPTPRQWTRGRVYEAILGRKMRVSAITLLIDTQKTGKLLFEDTAREEFSYALELAARTPFDYVPETLVRMHRNLGRNPHSGIAGRLRALERHDSALRAHPRALARHYYELGLAYVSVADARKARSSFWKSIKASPWDYRPWVSVVMLSFGADVSSLRGLRNTLVRNR